MLVTVRPARVEGLRVDDDRDRRALGARAVVQDRPFRVRESSFHPAERESDRELHDGVSGIDGVLLKLLRGSELWIQEGEKGNAGDLHRPVVVTRDGTRCTLATLHEGQTA